MSQPQNPPLPIPIRHELLQSETIAHGFFTRNGGVSPAPFQSLNLGLGSSDDPDNIRQNRARVALSLGFEPENLVSLYQIHSPLVVDIQTPLALDSRPQADSMISQTKGLLLGILTADCAPILFMDETAAIVGAVHAGWRGAVSGIIENTISAMVARGRKNPQSRRSSALASRKNPTKCPWISKMPSWPNRFHFRHFLRPAISPINVILIWLDFVLMPSSAQVLNKSPPPTLILVHLKINFFLIGAALCAVNPTMDA